MYKTTVMSALKGLAVSLVVASLAHAEDAAPAAPPAPVVAPAAAQPPPAPPAAEVAADIDAALLPVKSAVSRIDSLEHQVEAVRLSEPDLSQRRAEVGALLDETEKAAEQLKPLVERAKQQLDKLGQAPAKTDPAEPPQVAGERQRLSAMTSALEGGIKSTELVRERGRQLGLKIQEMRHGLFTQRLFERTQSPLLPQTWMALWNDLPGARNLFLAVFGTWQTIVMERQQTALAILAVAVLAFLILRLLAARTMRRAVLRPDEEPAGFMRRASAACLVAPMIAAPGLVAASILYGGFEGFGLVYSRVEEWLQDAFQGVVILVIAASLATAILEPGRPQWRLVDLHDRAARSLWRTLFGFAFVYAIDLIAKQTIRLLALPLPFSIALSFITSFALAALLIRAALIRFVKNDPVPLAGPEAGAPEQSPAGVDAGSPSWTEVRAAGPKPPRNRDLEPRFDSLGTEHASGASPLPAPVPRLAPRWLKIPMLAVAAAILAAALSGYVALGRFAAGQVVITGSAVVLAILLHLTIQTMERALQSSGTGGNGPGAWVASRLGTDTGQRQLIGRMLSAVLHVLVALALIPGLMLAWGFSSADVFSGLRSALFGFEIGRFKISLAQILLALMLFAAILLATRLLQRWLQGTVLRPDRLDPGIANSVHQGIGYAGFALALLAGVSFGGIDITNLAIVAGALSVGIGFGLQSIVNNFVSGLILLVERPIKVGDWVVVKGGGEGYVRAISVRSTEIETFDRASLIVPNSELISNVVTNWTHRNALGRVIIKVGTSYKADPSLVLKVLNDVAVASPDVMQQPPPLVSLDNLGADGLEFSIRVLVADINRALGVQTVLRAAVVDAFRQNGIEFPTPERDLYLRDLDGLKVLIAKIVEERNRQQAASASVVPPAMRAEKT